MPLRDLSYYEVFLPRPSHSVVGRFNDCHQTTIPYVRTFLRAEAYARTVTRHRQAGLDGALSRPRVVNHPRPEVLADRERQRHLPALETRLAHTVPEELPPGLPPVPVPRYAHVTRRQQVEEQDAASDRYSETPIHERRAQSKVFDLPEYVARERAIITAGRTFTWGGRQRLQLPSFDPHRERLLNLH